MPSLDWDSIRHWISGVVQSYGDEIGKLNYCFCDDDHILSTNRKFLNHDYYTDIITFDYSYKNKISGDMVISLDTVGSNAELQGVCYEDELYRVIIHGVLHLIGINDKGPGEREIMEKAENKALNLLKEIFGK